MVPLFSALAALCVSSPAPADIPTGPALRRMAYLLASDKPVAAPKVEVDSKEAPDLAEWGEEAGKLVAQWYPVVWNLLATEDSKPATTIKVTFQLKQDAPAYATGGGIFVSVPWVRAHPDDFGMMIHEMTHLVQSYPGSRSTPGWLVEGVADYIRWWRYEPEAPRPRINAERDKYSSGYRITAAFLAFVTQKYDRGLVRTLDRAMKEKKYSDTLFETATGKNLDTLWSEFLDAQPKPVAK